MGNSSHLVQIKPYWAGLGLGFISIFVGNPGILTSIIAKWRNKDHKPIPNQCQWKCTYVWYWYFLPLQVSPYCQFGYASTYVRSIIYADQYRSMKISFLLLIPLPINMDLSCLWRSTQQTFLGLSRVWICTFGLRKPRLWVWPETHQSPSF